MFKRFTKSYAWVNNDVFSFDARRFTNIYAPIQIAINIIYHIDIKRSFLHVLGLTAFMHQYYRHL